MLDNVVVADVMAEVVVVVEFVAVAVHVVVGRGIFCCCCCKSCFS